MIAACTSLCKTGMVAGRGLARLESSSIQGIVSTCHITDLVVVGSQGRSDLSKTECARCWEQRRNAPWFTSVIILSLTTERHSTPVINYNTEILPAEEQKDQVVEMLKQPFGYRIEARARAGSSSEPKAPKSVRA